MCTIFLLYTGREITLTLPHTFSALPIAGQFVMALMQVVDMCTLAFHLLIHSLQEELDLWAHWYEFERSFLRKYRYVISK